MTAARELGVSYYDVSDAPILDVELAFAAWWARRVADIRLRRV